MAGVLDEHRLGQIVADADAPEAGKPIDGAAKVSLLGRRGPRRVRPTRIPDADLLAPPDLVEQLGHAWIVGRERGEPLGHLDQGRVDHRGRAKVVAQPDDLGSTPPERLDLIVPRDLGQRGQEVSRRAILVLGDLRLGRPASAVSEPLRQVPRPGVIRLERQ